MAGVASPTTTAGRLPALLLRPNLLVNRQNEPSPNFMRNPAVDICDLRPNCRKQRERDVHCCTAAGAYTTPAAERTALPDTYQVVKR